MSDPYVTIASSLRVEQAEMIRLQLEANGIEAVIVGGGASGWIVPSLMATGCSVRVLEADVERSVALLAKIEADGE